MRMRVAARFVSTLYLLYVSPIRPPLMIVNSTIMQSTVIRGVLVEPTVKINNYIIIQNKMTD